MALLTDRWSAAHTQALEAARNAIPIDEEAWACELDRRTGVARMFPDTVYITPT